MEPTSPTNVYNSVLARTDDIEAAEIAKAKAWADLELQNIKNNLVS